MRGPIDYIIVGFEGDKFNGGILREIGNAIENGTIGLVAMAFIQKDSQGNVNTFNIEDLGDEYAIEFSTKYKSDNNLVTQDDIDEVSELVESNTSVGLLIIEQLWAKPLKKALLDANGVLVAEGRIHPDANEELNSMEDK